MATLINGNGNQAIYAAQDADWYAAIMGGTTTITAVGNQFAYELLDANTIGVKDGVIITKEGRRIQLDANAIDTFDIPTGSQGSTNYYIIGYHLVTGTQSEQTCETFVQLMESSSATIPEGSFRDGDDDVYISLYRVRQNDLTIGTVTLLLPKVTASFAGQIAQLNSDLTANNKTFKASYQNGKYGFMVGSAFYQIGGGGMPELDFANAVDISKNTSGYTTTKAGAIVGRANSGSACTISANGIAITMTAGSLSPTNVNFIPAGTVLKASSTNTSAGSIYFVPYKS